MNKLILCLTVLISMLSINSAFSQCSPDGSINTPGIIASPSSVDCISRGVAFDDTIQFMNFDSIYFNNTWVDLLRLRIDSVNNLPCGINWQLSNANGIYQNSEAGCISLYGTTYDTIGQYKLDVWASIDLGSGGFLGPIQANNFDLLTFYTRVKYQAASCPFIDTLAVNTLSACSSTDFELTLSTTNDSLCWDIHEEAAITAIIENGSGHYSYQWNYSDTLSCDTCQSVTFDSDVFETGVFPVTVTVYDSISGISATDTIDMVVEICTGVKENKNSRLTVYPNPGNGNYNIEFPGNPGSSIQMKVQDMQGKEIRFKSYSLSANRFLLDISEAGPGIYFLVASHGSKIYHNKLIRQ